MELENNFLMGTSDCNLKIELLGLSLIIKRESTIIKDGKIPEDILENKDFNKLIESVETSGKKLLNDIIKKLRGCELSDESIFSNVLNIVDWQEKKIVSLIFENAKVLIDEGTPTNLSKLMIHILDIKDNSQIMDAFSGGGNIDVEISKENSNVKIDGYEINETAILISKIKAYAIKKDFQYVKMDIFKEKIESKYDYAIADIPFINIYDLEIIKTLENINNEINFKMKNRISGSYICALKVLEALKDNGKTIMTFVTGSLFNTLDKEIRKKLITNNYIEEVINLPVGILANSSLEIALVVFNKNKKDKNIKFVDLKKCYTKKRLY